MDWKAQLILAKISEGLIYREVALAVGISRQTVLKRMAKSPELAQAVAQAREAGKEERTFRLWLGIHSGGGARLRGRATTGNRLLPTGGGRNWRLIFHPWRKPMALPASNGEKSPTLAKFCFPRRPP